MSLPHPTPHTHFFSYWEAIVTLLNPKSDHVTSGTKPFSGPTMSLTCPYHGFGGLSWQTQTAASKLMSLHVPLSFDVSATLPLFQFFYLAAFALTTLGLCWTYFLTSSLSPQEMGFLSLICYLLEGRDHICELSPHPQKPARYMVADSSHQRVTETYGRWWQRLSLPWRHPISRWTVALAGGPLLLPTAYLPTLLHSGMSSFRRERGDIIHNCIALPFNSSQMHEEAFTSSAFAPGILMCVSAWINDVKDPNTEKTHQSCKWH